MAFDKETRNKLARMVADARTLLRGEFTRQLQEIYGIQPDGKITEMEKLTHLDDEQRDVANLLRDRVEHLAIGMGKEKSPIKSAIDRMTREQSFTVLNRFAALRMCEERGLIQQCVCNGMASEGFEVYLQIAGTGLGDRYERYCSFIFCVFDEIGVDLGILFDRFSPFGLLFPREAVLIDLVEILNQKDLKHLWAEDETIGWIYQYYNDPGERKKMRKASAAPRNSRELAVRNQFFTPRYVVEFLTDNTLGRIWYEMNRGKTRLADQCRYLVRRPIEIFLAEGEAAPEMPDQEGLKQEELLKQPVHIPHRPYKDPREIRLLDPACGSMHFGLYAFDLFETIYEEAWNNGSCPALQGAYSSKDEFLMDVPRLIIEHNIHGIDIDPRAVQIAGLSLWLRAQKAGQAQGVKSADRPRVRRSNIVCAEPMPGSSEMLEGFVDTLDPPLLGELVRTVFDKMQLAGEAGSLLKIEEEIRTAIDEAQKDWKRTNGQLPGFETNSKSAALRHLSSGFWETIESRLLDALRAYAEQADADSYQRRLFADDAARGFAFIDLCRKRFDAVVMNPPFGAFSKEHKKDAKSNYPNSSNDIYAAFVDRFLLKLFREGLLGAITSRACFFTTSFIDWRDRVVRDKTRLVAMADLGESVMDDAMVEAAAYILCATTNPADVAPTFWCREFSIPDRDSGLLDSIQRMWRAKLRSQKSFFAPVSNFESLEGHPYVYWVSVKTLAKLSKLPKLEPTIGEVRKGLRTGDNFRFVRCLWEVPNIEISPDILPFAAGGDRDSSGFVPLVLSGSSQPWFSPLLVVLNWKTNGRELRTYVLKYGTESRLIQGKDFYFRPGISWTRRATRFVPYAVPAGCIPTGSRPMAFPMRCEAGLLLAVTASNVASAFMRFYGEKFLWPNFLEGKVKLLPWPTFSDSESENLQEFVANEVRPRRLAYRHYEPFHEFLCPFLDLNNVESNDLEFTPMSLLGEANENLVQERYDLSQEDAESLYSDLGEALQIRAGTAGSDGGDADDDESADDGVDAVIVDSKDERSRSILSYLLGTAFGRWDIRYATGERQSPELPDPFDPLPVCPPGMLQNAEGLPAEPKDVPAEYPLRISWPGILVDDENHPEDIVSRVREAIEVIWNECAEGIEQEACDILGVSDLREYFRKPAKFFQDHLKRYSKSRRKAPIYWPLSTESGNYTIWIYYHRLNDQTLFSCVTDYLKPRIDDVSRDVERIQKDLAEGGTAKMRSDLEQLQDFRQELIDMQDELLRVAKLPYKPNLNDGVMITAAPLWRLFRLKSWQKVLKGCWEKLESGEYEWAHLVYSIWPDRVKEKCITDRSIAIAHDLEHLCEIEVKKPKKKKIRKKSAGLF